MRDTLIRNWAILAFLDLGMDAMFLVLCFGVGVLDISGLGIGWQNSSMIFASLNDMNERRGAYVMCVFVSLAFNYEKGGFETGSLIGSS